MELDLGLPQTLPKLATTERTQLPRTQITHDMIVDFLICNPTATYKEIGTEFSYSEVGIGVICRSDAFRMRFEMRKAEVQDPVVMEKIERRLEGLASKSLEILERHLQVSTDHKFALEVLKETNKAAGYGATKIPHVQNNYVAVLPGPAASSKEWSDKFGHGQPPLPVADVVEK